MGKSKGHGQVKIPTLKAKSKKALERVASLGLGISEAQTEMLKNLELGDDWIVVADTLIKNYAIALEKKEKELSDCPREEERVIEMADDAVWVEENLRLFNYIMGVRKQYLTMRDLWTSWLIVGVWRAFCALWVMICTPNAKDAKVGPIVQTLMKKYHFTSPESVLVAFKDLSYVEAAQKLGSELNPIMYHTNKASYILQTSLLCFLLEDGMPKTFEGLVCLPGVGPKIGDIVMFDGLGEVTGIPVDSHLARILVSLEWAEDGSDEEIAHSAMSWMPRECWGVVNECFAGLGQLLNDDQWKLQVKQDLLDVPEDELWMLEPIKALLAVYKL